MSFYDIAVDIGGTQMRAACYAQGSLEPSKIARISTKHSQQLPQERLIELIASIWPENGRVGCIAAAAPGPVDPYTGVIRAAPNIPGWINFPLQRLIEDQFHVPVALGNDANLAALGEWTFGAGQNHHHLIYLTISTGIGGGIITEDRLLLGRDGLAAEIGHITVIPDGPLCGCGQRGHLEALASGTAIARWVEQELEDGVGSILAGTRPITAKRVAEAAKQGDPLGLAAFARAGSYLGQALADFLHIFNPSILIFGGGVSQSGALLLDPMRTALQEHVFSPHYLDGLELTTALLGDDAGLMGALALARLPHLSNAQFSSG